MKTLYLLLFIAITISCNKSNNENSLKQEAYDKINEWYLSTNPLYQEGDEYKKDTEKDKLEKIVKFKNNIPNKFKIVHQERFIIEIDSYQAIIKINYYFESKDNLVTILSETYYYDYFNMEIPIKIKSIAPSYNDYSIMQKLNY